MISTKGRYSLRVMLDLAMHNTDKYTPLDEIAARQELSKKYLEIIIKSLVKSKLVKGSRGKGGGYKLTRLPEEYTVGEIIEPAEGTLAVIACLAPDADECPRCNDCMTLPMWQGYNNLLHDYFYSITLKDILEGRPLPEITITKHNP